MPGAYAHLTIVNEANSTNNLDSISLNDKAYDALLSWFEYVELGSVSPDYPYLAIRSKHCFWADCIHTEYKTKDIIYKGIELIKQMDDSDDKDKTFAWFCGFVAHILTDMVIHPVVELKVGPYKGNEKEHRICEMHQDSFVYPKLNLGGIGMSKHLKSGVSTCNHNDDEKFIFRPIRDIWEKMLEVANKEEFIQNKPEIDTWHYAFNKIVSTIDQGYRLFPLARHIAVNQGLTYPSEDNIKDEYIKNLSIPHDKKMDYDDIFEKALQTVLKGWEILSKAIYENDDEYKEFFGNWNMDNGRDKENNLIFW